MLTTGWANLEYKNPALIDKITEILPTLQSNLENSPFIPITMYFIIFRV